MTTDSDFRESPRAVPSPCGDPGAAERGRRPRVVLTLGKLDGVHAGHRHLAAHTIALADELGTASAAVVLHPDPATVLRGQRVARLTSLEDRCARLRAFGIAIVEPLRFTREIAALSAPAFVGRLADRFDLAGMVVGPDFAFGHDRSGDIGVLRHLAAERGFAVHVVPPLEVGGEWLSSRRIRAMVEAGEVEAAREALCHPPRVVGTVVHGAARGRRLGFPTANLDPTADFALPANGIYTVRASWAGLSAAAVASVGVRPTFDNGERLVEVHLLDFEGDLYGVELTVDFLSRQRAELRFESVEALVDQMKTDVRVARQRHEREAAPQVEWSDGEHGVTALVRAPSLAAACEAAARGLAGPTAADGAAPVAALDGVRHRVVAVRADGDEALMGAWLSVVAASGLRDARVYAAGSGALHALARDPGGVVHAVGQPLPTAPAVESVRRSDGWIEARVRRVGSAPAAAAPYR